MKLDKKMSRLPYTCFEKDECEEFVGQMGYFTDVIENYSDLEDCYHKRLKNILSDYNDPFYATDNTTYRFFFPDALLKEPAKQLRPFETVEELPFGALGSLYMRHKSEPERVYLTSIQGFIIKHDKLCSVIIFSKERSMVDLMNEWEWKFFHKSDLENEWQPFGVFE